MRSSEPDSIVEVPESIGPFRITGLLGEGGSARVYAVTRDGEELALKVPRERELTPKEQDRFLEEAKMLERVRHRAVVEVLDSGRLPDGQPYLLMRRFEGETLADRLARGGALPLEQALALFEQLASATEALHAAGLLHRDLKPENVLLVDSGRSLKLIDFGIAKDIDAPASTTTQAGVARGTPATMAPERFFGASASKSTDVYELAVVFYTMVAGRLPWSEVTNPNSRLNPLSLIEAGVPVSEALSNVVMRALSTRPERRPPSVVELAREIRNAARAAGGSGRVTAATTSVPPPPGDALVTQKSEEAQVLESRRDPKSRRSATSRMIGLGLVVVGLGGIAIAASIAYRANPPVDSGKTAALGVTAVPPVTEAPTRIEEPARSEADAIALESLPLEAAATTAHQPAKPSAAPPKAGDKPAPSAKPEPSQKPQAGKPKGAPCTRSSECASMQCAAETCQ